MSAQCLLFLLASLQIVAASLPEDDLSTCMMSTSESDFCNGLYLSTFYQLDTDDDGVLSPEERAILFETPIDRILLPRFFPEENEVCSYEHFCETLVTIQFPDISEQTDDDLVLERVCLMESAAVQDSCEEEWLQVFPERVPSQDEETSGVEMTRDEFRQITLDTFNPVDGLPWNVDAFLEWINPHNDHNTMVHFNQLLSDVHSGSLATMPIDFYTETVNDCPLAVPEERRELFLGIIAVSIAAVVVASLAGATVQTVSGNNQDFGSNLASHLITNTITTVGCGFSNGAGCIMAGAVGGYVGGAALCSMSGDDDCWNVNDRAFDTVLGAAAAAGGRVSLGSMADDLALAAGIGFTTGMANAMNSLNGQRIDAYYSPSSGAYMGLTGTCIGGHNARTYNGVSKNDCANYCDQDSRCKSFDWRLPHYGYNCAISHVRATDVPAAFSTGCLTWNYFEKANIQRYNKRVNYAIGGHNYRTFNGKSLNECAQACSDTSQCKSFDWRPFGGYNCALNYVKCPHSHCSVSDAGGWDGNGPWNYFGKIGRRSRLL